MVAAYVTGENSSLIAGVQVSFEEAKQCLAQMEIEIRKLSIDERRIRQKHYEGFVEEMRRLETEFRKAKRGALGDDEVNIDLFEAESEDGDSNTKLLPDSNSSRKLCLESEELGSKIMNSLSEKRDTIGKSRERLRKSNYDLGNSSKIANMILRKAMHNKLMIYTNKAAVPATPGKAFNYSVYLELTTRKSIRILSDVQDISTFNLSVILSSRMRVFIEFKDGKC
ncbi:vesicle transport through interaction with t-SNAREs 1A-like protein [Leptotrombidium deliense]|uniref:Vesicle transport through interaction with t-SNAREs 1A-like protein n=1 Tax=Leptotrombidium deliense TaxID=299467 RepID=A0A443SWG5_9ACAR|nr:vesicle transport through interaction with t-SNAREs 1A-like protein [Leptotrombidium deliense]